MKTIEQLAKEWADKKMPISDDVVESVIDTDVNNIYYHIYTEIATETLTSLLEELPEPDRTNNSQHIYQTAYYHKIKSLIQNKLK